MTTEYVKLSHPELVYGETNLLQSQISVLTMIKKHREYKELRKEELLLKIDFRKKLNESRELLDYLDKILPKTNLLEEMEEKEALRKEIIKKIEFVPQKYKMPAPKAEKIKIKEIKEQEKPVKQEKAEKSSLDQELEEIRAKLAKLG